MWCFWFSVHVLNYTPMHLRGEWTELYEFTEAKFINDSTFCLKFGLAVLYTGCWLARCKRHKPEILCFYESLSAQVCLSIGAIQLSSYSFLWNVSSHCFHKSFLEDLKYGARNLNVSRERSGKIFAIWLELSTEIPSSNWVYHSLNRVSYVTITHIYELDFRINPVSVLGGITLVPRDHPEANFACTRFSWEENSV